MSKTQNQPAGGQLTQNQNNAMSEDPDDGSRNSDTLGRDGKPTAAEKKPPHDRHDVSTIEAFGEEGAGVDAKE